MKLKPEQLQQALKKELAPIYIISGDEPLIIQESCDLIRAAAREAGHSERELYHSDNQFDWGQLHYSGQAMSLFGDKKLIEIRSRNKLPDKGRKALLEYAERPPSDTLLLLVLPKLERATQNAKWFKSLEAASVFIQVWPVNRAQLPRWISARAKQKGLQLEPAALDILVSRSEGNLLAASQELEKLTLLTDNGKVDAHLMAQSSADSARFDVFGLVDRALVGDARSATHCLHGLKQEGTDAIVVLWALAKEIRTLLQLREALDKGQNFNSIARKFGVWDNRQSVVQNALKRLRKPQLQQLLRQAGVVDRAIKGMSLAEPWEECLSIVMSLAGVNALSPINQSLTLSENLYNRHP